MRVSSRERRIVALGLLVALGIVGWVYVLSPMQQRWRKASRHLKASRAELEKLQRVAQEGRRYAERREQIAKMVIQTPDLEAAQRVVPVLINAVEDCGHRRRVQITRYDPLPPKIQENYAEYSLSLNLHSDLDALVQFLKDLRETRPVINIKRLHIVPPGPTAKTQDLTAELLLSTCVIAHKPESKTAQRPDAVSGA